MDDELYRFHYSSNIIPSCPDVDSNINFLDHHHHQQQQFVLTADHGLEMPDLIKTQIANHPLYLNLVTSYIECRKVGAPPEMASLLEEISKENTCTATSIIEIGTDPELDHFMKSYCEVLQKYKEELSRPFDEATNFLSSIESQLTDLCKQTLPTYNHSADDDDGDDGGGREATESQESSSNYGEGIGEDLKEMLMKKYSGYLSTLRKEFLKKRKKGKLPKDARTALLDWWNTHYRWPYPTEEEKRKLSETTGLDQKQINNWFINQRKRHWRPSEDMRFALMEGVTGYFGDTTAGTGGIGT